MVSQNKKTLPRIGLALGSGGARGWSEVGVLQVLREMNVPVSCVAGTSIGAIIGAAYTVDRLDLLQQISRDRDWRRAARLFAEAGLPRAGLASGKRIQHLLQDIVVVKNIEDLPMPFAAVAADLEAQCDYVFTHGPLVDALRASSAIPGVLVPVRHDNRNLVDGGLVNPVPVSIARSLGADIVIAVDVNRRPGTGIVVPKLSSPNDDSSFRARFSEYLPQIPDKMADSVQRWMRDPQSGLTIFDVMTRAVRLFENQITALRMAQDPPDILIQPAVGDINTLEFHRSAAAIEAGRAATLEVADQIKELLADNGALARKAFGTMPDGE